MKIRLNFEKTNLIRLIVAMIFAAIPSLPVFGIAQDVQLYVEELLEFKPILRPA